MNVVELQEKFIEDLPRAKPATLFERTGCAYAVNDGGPYLFCNEPTRPLVAYCDHHYRIIYPRLRP